MDSQAILKQLTSDACIALFRDYSLPLNVAHQHEGEVDSALLYCSVIGFSSLQMKGTLLLAATSELLARTASVQGTSLQEWIAELSNQLLGRIKQLLVDRGLVLAISTPIVVRGERLRPLPNEAATPLAFACESGCVWVWIDAEIAAGLDLSQVQNGNEGLDAGEALLF
jgi:hypothetical protein